MGNIMLMLLLTVALSSAVQGFPTRAFILGDSLVDVGTNNLLNPGSPFRCDHDPYGITLQSTTGRCSNGLLISDLLLEELHLNRSTPYLELGNGEVPSTINFASASSGYRDVTGWGLVNSFSNQVEQLKDVARRLGSEQLKDALFLISAGGNDLIFLEIGAKVDDVVEAFKVHLQHLYEIGARKFVILGVGPVGCIPLIRQFQPYFHCNEKLNAEAQYLNQGFEKVIDDKRRENPDLLITFFDGYKMVTDMFKNGTKYGFTADNFATCCPFCASVDANTINVLLNSTMVPQWLKSLVQFFEFGSQFACKNPDEYLFFDHVHPTERAYKIITKSMLNGELDLIRPYNVLDLFKPVGVPPPPAPPSLPPAPPSLPPAPTPSGAETVTVVSALVMAVVSLGLF